jgi:integrase
MRDPDSSSTDRGSFVSLGVIMRFFLQEKAYKPRTAKRYRSAVLAFHARLVEWGEDPQTWGEMDLLFVEHIHELFMSGQGKGRSGANNALYGLAMLLPESKLKMPSSRLSLRGWAKEIPSVSFPPITWELALAVAFVIQHHLGSPEGATAVLLAFDAYLRISEVTGLVPSDVASGKGDPRMPALYRKTALRLRHTKTGKNQFVSVGRKEVEALLLRRVERVSPGTKLFPSAARLRSLFKRALHAMGVDHLDFVFHSLRHGAATTDMLLGRSLDFVLMRGRWAAAKSARHYIQAGRAQLLATRVPLRLADLGRRLGQDIGFYFSLRSLTL